MWFLQLSSLTHLLVELHARSHLSSTHKMALPVRLFVFIQTNVIMQHIVAGAPENDYGAVSGEIVQFNVGDTSRTHTIIINDDMMCENDPSDFFFSNIALDSGVQPIFVIHPQAIVTVNDDEEPECRKPWFTS